MKKIISGLLILLSLIYYRDLEAREIKQSTASNVMVFMTDSADYIAGKASLTLTITASEDGAAFSSITPTVTERGNGWYNLALTSTHTDTLGDLCLHITATGSDPTDFKHVIVANIESDTYSETTNASYGLSKLVRATTPANTLDIASTGEAGLDFSNIKQATGSTTLTNIIVPTVTAVTDDVGITQAGADKAWSTTIRTLTAGTNIVLAKGTGITGFNDITAASVWDTNISAYAGAGYAGTYLKNLWDKKPAGNMVSDGIWDATKAGYLDAAVSSRLPTANITLNAGAVTVGTNNDKTDYSMLASDKNALVDLVWDEAASGHTTIGTFGKYLDKQLTTFNDITAASVWAVGTRSLTDKAGFTISGTKTTLDALNDITAASVWASPTRTLTSAFSAADIDLIWDEPIAGHLGNGSTGEKLNNASTAGNPWATDISSGYAGQAGEYLRNVKDATDGDKEGADYSGIEKMIRIQR